MKNVKENDDCMYCVKRREHLKKYAEYEAVKNSVPKGFDWNAEKTPVESDNYFNAFVSGQLDQTFTRRFSDLANKYFASSDVDCQSAAMDMCVQLVNDVTGGTGCTHREALLMFATWKTCEAIENSRNNQFAALLDALK